MTKIANLLQTNQRWAQNMEQSQPGFFQNLSLQQNPQYLWIGCSDSRVPATQICGLNPGEIFVHRNIANIVLPTDLNCQAVIEFSIEVLKVKHVIVCGHYGCRGVLSAFLETQPAIIENWIAPIRNLYEEYRKMLNPLQKEEQIDRLGEIHLAAQVVTLCHLPVVQKAWKKNQPLTIHGLIYHLADGRLKDMNLSTDAMEQIPDLKTFARSRLKLRTNG